MGILKITILGRGNAGCLTALHYGYYTRHRKDIVVELIHNPDINPEKVGQGTLLDPPNLLWKALGLNWYDNPINATPKFGILYEDWGKINKKSFASPFPFNHVALHYNPSKLQEVILKSGYFSVKEKHIESYKQIDSDYIFDCRGKHITDWEDYDPLISPLNSVLLREEPSKDCDINWTRSVATPDGWTFVIPNTTKTTSYGYLYNDEFTSTEKATSNFEELFNLTSKKPHHLHFKSYMAKTPILDERIILGGNRLFFLEPLEATAIEAYSFWARRTFDWIVNRATTASLISQEIIKYTQQIQNFILWHYSYGSKYNTPFWLFSGTLKIEDPEFDRILDISKASSIIDLFDNNERYGQWNPWSFKCWYNAMTCKKNG